MEKLGGIKSCDTQGKPHEFNVYRSPNGYSIHLDGREIHRTDTHLGAIQTVADEVAKRGHRRRGG